LRAGGTFEITRWILGWGDAAEVMRPPGLRRDVAGIRKHFQTHGILHESTPDIREHLLEATIIKEMERKTSSKFDGILGQIQPVRLYGRLPFQVPIPFSASEGRPVPCDRGGHIDILARRRGKDNRVRLSVWELKRPGQINHAAFQSYIYAVVLRYMLRSTSGEKWYRLFGYRGRVPPSLEVESVVLLSETMKHAYEAQVDTLFKHNPMTIDGDHIIPYVAYYSWRDGKPKLTSFAPPMASKRTAVGTTG